MLVVLYGASKKLSKPMRKLDTNTLVVTSNQFNDAQLNVNIYETLGEFQNVGDIHLPLRPHEKSEV